MGTLLAAFPLLADDCREEDKMARNVLICLRPNAKYDRHAKSKECLKDKDNPVCEGKIFYKDVDLERYTMEVRVHFREKYKDEPEFRVDVIENTSPFDINKDCKYKNWTSMKVEGFWPPKK